MLRKSKNIIYKFTYQYRTSKQYAEPLSIVTQSVNIDQLTKVLHTEIVYGTATGK